MRFSYTTLLALGIFIVRARTYTVNKYKWHAHACFPDSPPLFRVCSKVFCFLSGTPCHSKRRRWRVQDKHHRRKRVKYRVYELTVGTKHTQVSELHHARQSRADSKTGSKPSVCKTLECTDMFCCSFDKRLLCTCHLKSSFLLSPLPPPPLSCPRCFTVATLGGDGALLT